MEAKTKHCNCVGISARVPTQNKKYYTKSTSQQAADARLPVQTLSQ